MANEWHKKRKNILTSKKSQSLPYKLQFMNFGFKGVIDEINTPNGCTKQCGLATTHNMQLWNHRKHGGKGVSVITNDFRFLPI